MSAGDLPGERGWNGIQRLLWAALLSLALLAWLALVLLVQDLHGASGRGGPVHALNLLLRWVFSAFAGIGIAFACSLLGPRPERSVWRPPPRWLVFVVVLTMLVAYGLWRVSIGFVGSPAA